jgi:ElaB/YqjD/DUF883 family membrane-anchored ribosome-binding protein
MDQETRRVGEIEADIAETRVELSETIEAIQERLTPSNIVANAKESVRHATTEKVRQMTDNPFIHTVRANPIPSAMIGIGAAWLLLKNRSDTGNGYRSPGDGRRARGYRSGPSRGSGDYDDDYAVGSGGPATYEGVSEAREGFGESVGSMARDLTSRTREMAGDIGDTARETTHRAQLKFNDVLRDNPLMLGAAAALIGAAVGMSIPSTETENQLMGEARDAVVDRAQNLASDAANQVSEAAGSVQRAAGSVRQAANTVAGTNDSDSSSSAGGAESTGAGSRSRRRGGSATQS